MNRSLARALTLGAITIAVLSLCVGCGDSSKKSKPADDPVPSVDRGGDRAHEEAAGKTKKHRKGKRQQNRKGMTRLRANNPPMVLVRTAMNRLDITDEQRQGIRSLMQVTRPNRKKKLAAQQELKLNLANAVEKGKIEGSLFEKVYNTSNETNNVLLTERSGRIEKLHQLLTQQQRTLLVEIVRKEIEQVAAATAAATAASSAVDGGPGTGRKSRTNARREKKKGPVIGKTIRRLNLSGQQRRKLDQLEQQIARELASDSPEHGTREKQLHTKTLALAKLFVKDDFKASDWKPITSKTPEERAGEIADRARRVQMLVDVLTAEQRGELANLLRSSKRRQKGGRPVVIKKAR